MCKSLFSFAWPAFGLITLSFISSKTVLKICQCFGELTTSSAVLMKIEVASLSFCTNVRTIVSQNQCHTQKSWEGLQKYEYQARWPLIAVLFMWHVGAETTSCRKLAMFADPLPEEKMPILQTESTLPSCPLCQNLKN